MAGAGRRRNGEALVSRSVAKVRMSNEPASSAARPAGCLGPPAAERLTVTATATNAAHKRSDDRLEPHRPATRSHAGRPRCEALTTSTRVASTRWNADARPITAPARHTLADVLVTLAIPVGQLLGPAGRPQKEAKAVRVDASAPSHARRTSSTPASAVPIPSILGRRPISVRPNRAMHRCRARRG